MFSELAKFVSGSTALIRCERFLKQFKITRNDPQLFLWLSNLSQATLISSHSTEEFLCTILQVFVNPSLFTKIEGRILLRNQRSNILASPCSAVPAHYTAMFCLSLLQPSAHGGAKQSCRSCSSPWSAKKQNPQPSCTAHNHTTKLPVSSLPKTGGASLRPWTTERITIERATLEWITNTLPENWNVKIFEKKKSQENVGKERERYGLQSSNWCRPLKDIFQSCIWASWPRIDSGVHPRGM